MIDDLKANHPIYKFVDDSTFFEIVNKDCPSTLQTSINQTVGWTEKNDTRLTAKKTWNNNQFYQGPAYIRANRYRRHKYWTCG